MYDESIIDFEYNHKLKELERVLKGANRPGNFYVTGTEETPMPAIKVQGLGHISFPIPITQAKELVKIAERAPYGRGGETIVDTKVRKVWQVSPGKVTLSGKHWEKVFAQIVQKSCIGLGVDPKKVDTSFYKMLIYDKGSFFKIHRDTEKTDGMFATLSIVLPSEHCQ